MTSDQIPDVIRDKIRRRPGWIPLRVSIYPTNVMWRAVPNLEHATICAAFGLDPATFWFDLPNSALGTGSNRVGAGTMRTRRIDGFVLRGPKGSDPVGVIAVPWEDERPRDRDPLSRSDFFRLGDSR